MSKKENISEKFTHLFNVISSKRFLEKEGLGNEVPFFITTFESTNQNIVASAVAPLIKRLAAIGIDVLGINLYDLIFEIIEERGILDKILEREKLMDKEKFLRFMQSALDVESKLIPAIKQKMALVDFNVLFVTGVGLVFPYIRSHNLLNNLQKIAKAEPTLMFFPGKYTYDKVEGSKLNLFGLMVDDKYYRAFNIDKLQV